MKRPQFHLSTLVWLTLVVGLAAAWLLQLRTSRNHLHSLVMQQILVDEKQTELEFQRAYYQDDLQRQREYGEQQHQAANLARIQAAFPEELTGVNFRPPATVGLSPNLQRLRLASTWADVQMYRFRSTELSPAALAELKRQKSVISLTFQDTQPTPEFLGRLAQLPQLQRINLENCAIGDEHLAAIATIESLRSLGLSHNPKISDAGIESLTKLTNLIELEIHATNLGDQSLPFLKRLPLRRIRIDGTRLTKSGREELEQTFAKKQPGVVDWHLHALPFPR